MRVLLQRQQGDDSEFDLGDFDFDFGDALGTTDSGPDSDDGEALGPITEKDETRSKKKIGGKETNGKTFDGNLDFSSTGRSEFTSSSKNYKTGSDLIPGNATSTSAAEGLTSLSGRPCGSSYTY